MREVAVKRPNYSFNCIPTVLKLVLIADHFEIRNNLHMIITFTI